MSKARLKFESSIRDAEKLDQQQNFERANAILMMAMDLDRQVPREGPDA